MDTLQSNSSRLYKLVFFSLFFSGAIFLIGSGVVLAGGGGGSSSGGSSSGGTSATYTKDYSAAKSSAQGYTNLSRALSNNPTSYSAVSTYSSSAGWGYTVQKNEPYKSDGNNTGTQTTAVCASFPNLVVTDILFVVPGASLTPTAVKSYSPSTGSLFTNTSAGTIAGVNQSQLTINAQYEPVVEITNSSCASTATEKTTTTSRTSFFGFGATQSTTSGLPNSFHVDQLPFGQNGSFPVRLQVDFQNDSSYEVTQFFNNQGPLSAGQKIYVRFPAISINQAGVHGIVGTADVTLAEAPSNSCAGSQGCILEGTQTANSLKETFSVIVPAVRIGSFVYSGPQSSITSTNQWLTYSYTTADKRLTDRDLAIDPFWNKSVGFGGKYTNVGLYWTGTLVNLNTCTGTTIKNDGTTLSDFNGQVDVPVLKPTGSYGYFGGTTITGFTGSGHNLDMQINEPNASTSHLYTITCQTTTGGIVSDSVLITNGLGNICAAGLVWNGLTCSTGGINSLQGSDCTIPANQSSCNASFNWDLNGASSPQVRNTTTNVTYPNANSVVTNAMHPITYGPNIIQSRDGSTVLRQITVTGSCAASAPWDGSKGVCYSAALPPATPGTISVTAASSVVRKFDTATVRWQISNPIPAGYTCSLNGPGLVTIPITTQSGSRQTQPIDSTSIFTVSCTNGITPVSGEVTIEIIPQVQEV